MRLRWPVVPVVLLAVLGPWPAAASVSLLLEATGARQFTAISLMGELELVRDRTFLTACFSSSRSAPLEITGAPGTDPLTISIPRSNQACLGLDHGLTDHWRVSAMASLSPKVTSQVLVLDRPTLVFRSENGSAGGFLGISYDTANPLDDVQWGADLGLAVNAYSLSHSWITAFRTRRFPSMLGSLRPGAGVVVLVGDTQWQLRGSYTFYSQDPLRAGAVSEDELLAVDAVVQRFVDASQYYGLNAEYGSFLQQTTKRLMAADALSGLSTAPIWFELHPSVEQRFSRWLKGQVGYTYDRYVPGAGQAHVASTKWTVTFSGNVQSWVAAAAQLDVPGSVPPKLYGILTLGVEVSF